MISTGPKAWKSAVIATRTSMSGMAGSGVQGFTGRGVMHHQGAVLRHTRAPYLALLPDQSRPLVEDGTGWDNFIGVPLQHIECALLPRVPC